MLWRVASGRTFSTKEAAEAHVRDTVSRGRLLSLIMDGESELLPRFASAAECVEWMIRNRDEVIHALEAKP